MKPIFFPSADAFSTWLDRHGERAAEVWVGFHKKGSSRAGITYGEALDEALRSGWIDGLRKRLDEDRFLIRFTPRKAKSNWSAVNIRRVGELAKGKKMKPAGLAAFERRPSGPAPYSHETAPRELDAASAKLLRANPRALAFFESQAPSYRRMASFWVMSAKKDETRARRLQSLIECSAKAGWIPPLRWAINAPDSKSAAARKGRRRA